MRKTWLMKLSLLSISLVLTSNTAIASALPMMLGYFNDQSASSVELLMTIPQLTVVIFIALSSLIAKSIGQKKTVLLGLLLAGVAGVFPVFTANFYLLMISRAALGAGFGLFNSLAVSMISEFFEGEEAATLIGFQSAFQGLGAAVMTFTAGRLLTFGWQKAFLVYLITIPIIFLFMAFVPEPSKKKETTSSEKETAAKGTLRPTTVMYGILIFFLCIFYMIVVVKLSTFIVTENLGTESDAGTLLSFMQIANMVAGFLFGLIYKGLKRWTLPISFFIMATSLFLILTANHLWMIGIGAALNGIAFALFVPYIFNDATRLVPQSAKASTTSFILVLANIGNFVSPYGHQLLETFGIGSDALQNIFINGCILMTGLGILFLLLAFKKDPLPNEA
ncbi:MFS transporter [Enterococcus sp. DIV1298c]|uniref:MFS transporter n=1 Tax=Enterococcus sp. DIV1298c TaxID=2815328 RepID=UPI001A9318D8|nr:MFS transporter [Enterococcus sp. DIV1298c]MBO0461587.1 MFS transporter [Enterococcus sp. DIV1298c]